MQLNSFANNKFSYFSTSANFRFPQATSGVLQKLHKWEGMGTGSGRMLGPAQLWIWVCMYIIFFANVCGHPLCPG